jgi:hypothetical protein
MNKFLRKSTTVFVSAVLLSMLLEWIFGIYLSGSAPGLNSPPTIWYVYTSDLVTYLVKALPASFAGYALKRSGFLVGTIVGMASEAIQMVFYIWQYPPPVVTWPLIELIISNLCVYSVIGCIAGAAGELVAERRSNYSSNRTRGKSPRAA